MTTYHPDLAAGRWFTLTLASQLGNVGSEYERASKWKRLGDADRFHDAFSRLLELIDLTIADPRWKNRRLRELTRLREVICDELFSETREFDHPTNLSSYFLYFGVLARNERDRAIDAVVA
jgi:hypothetical protein